MGKGSGRRPRAISRAEYEANYERIFPPKPKQAPPPVVAPRFTWVNDDDEFERLAELFHRDTGYIAPGKDVPAAIYYDGYSIEQRRLWSDWWKINK